MGSGYSGGWSGGNRPFEALGQWTHIRKSGTETGRLVRVAVAVRLQQPASRVDETDSLRRFIV